MGREEGGRFHLPPALYRAPEPYASPPTHPSPRPPPPPLPPPPPPVAQLTLQKKGLYTIASNPGTIRKGCPGIACYMAPPEPRPFPFESEDFGEGGLYGPAQNFVDVNGAFECLNDPTYGPLLQQTSSQRPLTAYTDSRPHTMTGDIGLTDVDVTVDFFLPYSYPQPGALLGGRVTPWNLTRGGASATGALDVAPGVWMYIDSYGWKVFTDLSLNTALASGSLPTYWTYGQWATMRLVIRGGSAIGMFYQKPSASEEEAVAGLRAEAATNPAAAAALGDWEAARRDHARNASALRGAGGKGAAGGYPTVPMTLKGTNATVDAALLFKLDVSAAPTAGFVSLATGDFGQAVQFRNFLLSVDATICRPSPVAGQAVEVELCSPDVGQAFDFQLVDTDPTHVTFSVLAGYDSEKEDSGEFSPCNAPGYAEVMQACVTAGDACAGFNNGCWMKTNLATLAQTGLTNLHVKQQPAGLWKLRSNNNLCLARSTAAPDVPPLQLAACNAGDANQLFTQEKTMTDGAWGGGGWC